MKYIPILIFESELILFRFAGRNCFAVIGISVSHCTARRKMFSVVRIERKPGCKFISQSQYGRSGMRFYITFIYIIRGFHFMPVYTEGKHQLFIRRRNCIQYGQTAHHHLLMGCDRIPYDCRCGGCITFINISIYLVCIFCRP